MSSSINRDDRERQLNEAAARYFELQATGTTIDRQQWLAQYPDLADELAGFLSDLDHFKHQDTQDPQGNPLPQVKAALAEHPRQIGRYRIEKVLGQAPAFRFVCGQSIHSTVVVGSRRKGEARFACLLPDSFSMSTATGTD